MITIKKCLHIWTNTPATGGPKDLPHVLALLLKATFLGSNKLDKHREAIKVFKKAHLILTEIKGARLNTQTLLDNIEKGYEKAIESYEKQQGEEFDLEQDLSDEEDADFVKDNVFNMRMLLISCPIIQINAAMIVKTRLEL